MRKATVAPTLLLSALGFSAVRADEPQEKKSEEVKVATVIVRDDGTSEVKVEEDSPHLWLGVGLKSIEGDLAEFLGSSHGVLVNDVYDGSPAGKAGFKKGDIILSVDARELSGPSDLLETMKSAKEGVELKCQVQRKSESVEIKVTPVARPKDVKLTLDLSQVVEGDGKNFQFHFDPEHMKVFRFGSPAGVVTSDLGVKGNLSLSMATSKDGKATEVKINRKEGQPAEITVTQNGESKQYTEEQIEEIPEEVRGWVAQSLKQPGGKSWISIAGLPNLENEELAALKMHLSGGSLEKAEKALQKALAHAASGAEESKAFAEALGSPEFRKELEAMRVRIANEVSEATNKATAEAKAALDDVRSRVQQSVEKTKADASEVEQLRQLVVELQKEIAELRSASKTEK